MTAAPGQDSQSEPQPIDPRFRLAFSPEEVATLLGVSRELVVDLIRTGQLRSRKAGRRRLISRRHIDEFLATGESLEHEPTPTPLPSRRVG